MRPRPPKAIVPRELLLTSVLIGGNETTTPKAIAPRELPLTSVLTGGNETKTQGNSTERITVDLYAYREERDQDPLRQ